MESQNRLIFETPIIYLSFNLLKNLTISFTIKGIIDNAHTNIQSCIVKSKTLKIDAKNGIVITISCRNIPNITEANKYLFVNNPN